MKTLLATLIVATFSVASSAVFAQGAAPSPTPTPQDKGAAAAYQNPAAQKTAEEKAKEGMAAAEKSKQGPNAVKPDVHNPATMQAQQNLTKAGTNPAQAAANVEASKKVAKKKPTNVKDMSPEERAAWSKQMKEQSKP